VIEAWRVDYNTVRPHGSIGQRTPAAYAAELVKMSDGLSIAA
jgi:transposase InsO family protein